MGAPAQGPRPSLGVLDGIAIVVGVVVGIGIFRTPPLVAANVSSELAFVGVWLLGGLVTLIGALCYAELAASYANSGGEYHFLARAYGRRVAIMFGWARGTVIQTGAIAAVAFVFGDYANDLLPLGDAYGSACYAALAIVALTALNMAGTRHSKWGQRLFTLLTLAAIGAVLIAGLLSPAPAPAPAASAAGEGSALGMAMVFVLLTYGGWNEAAYLSAEMRGGRRSIVWVLLGGTALLVVLYVLVNLAYLSIFGLAGIRDAGAIAAELMRIVGGELGALLLSGVIIAAALSTLNATLFTGARVYHAIGRDLPPFRRLGMWSERGENPANAFLLQGVIALALVALGAATRDGFEAMVEYTAPVFWFFLLLVGGALFILRWREPERRRPFEVPLYPLLPLLFCLVCAALVYSSVAHTGLGALIGIAVLLAGLPLLTLRARDGEALVSK